MPPMSLKSLYERFYLPLRLAAAAEHARYQYTLNIRAFGQWLGREATIDDLTDDNLAIFTGHLAKTRSPSTANKITGHLRSLWNFAARRGLLTKYPTWQKMPEYRRVPTAWTKAQLSQLFATIQQLTGSIGNCHERDFWQCLLAVMWDTGLRIGALMQAEWSDLDGEYLLIRAETQKDKEEQRFKLHADTLAALKRLGKREGKIFKWPYCKGTLWLKYDKILIRADLPHGRRDKFHRMRRSVASWFEEAGGNATELLGHSDRRVTQAYLDASILKKPEASDRLFRPGEGEKPAA